MNDDTMVYYVAGKTYLASVAVLRDGVYRSQYYGETLEQLAERHPGVQMMRLGDAWPQIESAQTKAYCHEPVEDSAEAFDEMLNVLPPAKWLRGKDSEAFFVPEALCGTIYTWHVRIGSRYWCLNRDGSRSPESIIAEVATALTIDA